MGFLKRIFKSNTENDFAINERKDQNKYPKTKIKVIPLSESDFEFMEWRRQRMARLWY